MGKIKYLSAFERGMVVGDRLISLSGARTATLLGFSRTTVSYVYQGHPGNLTQLWEALAST
jgi:hypothetical protein